MGKTLRRTPLGYKGTKMTAVHLDQILPSFLNGVAKSSVERPDLILAAWPQVIGAQLARMTEAEKWSDGVLFVRVNNSTLYQLLTERDKPKILHALREKFPKTRITNVVFRMR